MSSDFTATRALFDLPEGVIYLDGNSLGPLPRAVRARMDEVIAREWGGMLIRAWNDAGWIDRPAHVGARIARLIGAEPDSVVMGDTLSIKVYQALASALEMRSGRRVILSDSGNFPTDLYMAEGLIRTLGAGHELRIVEPDKVLDAIDEQTAAFLITEVDYRTGRRHDMAALTARAHEAGALAIWDLAHSAGAFPLDVAADGADFAVGCSYKYLNSGPGGPAFIYVAPRHHADARPALSGWMGHEAPFAFDLGYRPAAGIERMRVGTPPILQLAALDAALDVWEGVDMHDVRARSLELGDLFIAGVEARCPGLRLTTPREHEQRGSQVSFAHPEAYAIIQALIAEGVIGDFRAPETLRFGFTPLYLGADDITRAVDILARVMAEGRWDRPEYRRRGKVT
ncbi:MAG: kynureninase [Paracoccus sp. (in: a-proteobacteria)]|nr:kynureninase [Paracoccus sp. (in: a-proteobacteria)]